MLFVSKINLCYYIWTFWWCLMIIKVKNVENIIADKKPVNMGATCFIYDFSKNYYFKLFFSKRNGRNYQDLRRHYNFYKLKVLEILSRLNNVPYFIKPVHILKSDTSLLGYTTLKVNGQSLIKLPDDTYLMPLFNSINEIRNTIWEIAKNRIIPCDVACRNLIYDENHLYLLDLDESVFNTQISYETIYIETMNYILESIKYILVSELGTLKYFSKSITDLETLARDYDGSYLEDDKLKSLDAKYLNGDLNDYSLYFKTLLEIINNHKNCEVQTLGDIRKAIRRKR